MSPDGQAWYCMYQHTTATNEDNKEDSSPQQIINTCIIDIILHHYMDQNI